MEFGKPFLSLIDKHILLTYHASSVLAEAEELPYNKAQSKLHYKALNTFKGDPKTEVIRYADHVEEISLDYLNNHRWIYIKQHAIGVFSLLFKPVRGYFDEQIGAVKGYQNVTPGEFPLSKKLLTAFNILASPASYTLVIIQCLILLFVYIGMLPGLILLRSGQIAILILLFFTIVYFANLIVPPYNDSRLRLPFLPILLIVGAAGIDRLFPSLFSKKENPGFN
jgi:hypothetical protein